MYVADICNFYFIPREIRHYAWQAKVPKHDKMKLEHGISYFPLYVQAVDYQRTVHTVTSFCMFFMF